MHADGENDPEPEQAIEGLGSKRPSKDDVNP